MSDTKTLSITGSQLRDLVQPVMPLADKGDSLPVLNAVHLTSRGGYLVACATDRYRLGFSRAKIDAPEGLDVILPLPSLKAILATFKVSRFIDPDLTLTFEADRVFVTAGSIGLDIAEARIAYRTLMAEFPGVTGIMERAFPEKPSVTTEPVHVNPHLLADFARAAKVSEPMRVQFNGTRDPIGIAIGDDFRGVIMPTRLADGALQSANPLADWTDTLPAAKAPEAVSA